MFQKGYKRQKGGKKRSNLTSREIFKIIGKSTNVPHEKVQDVFQAWSEIIEYCTERGISIPIYGIGEFTYREFQAKKKGDVITYRKGFVVKDKDTGEIKRMDETTTITLEEDRPNYYVPKFKYYGSFKERIKEASYIYGEDK